MNAFPLAPFLLALGSDGFRPTLHDYQRLSLVLQTQGPWTITRLRDVLLALLVKDAEQEEIFRRRFNDFFKLPAEREAVFAELDLGRALAELRGLSPPESPPLQRPISPQRFQTPQPQNQWRRWLLPGGLLLTLFIALYAIGPAKTPVPIVALSHTTLDFPQQLPNTTSADSIITLANRGNAPLIIDSVTIAGADSKNFEQHANLTAGDTLAPGESRAIHVNFTPDLDSVRYHVASLLIHHNAADSLHTVLLQGRRLVPQSRRPDDTRRMRLYPNVPYVETVSQTPPSLSKTWQTPAAIAGLLLVSIILYGLYLWRSRKIPEDKAPPWDPNGPRHFPLGKIGGPLPPRLDGATLDQLADAMGYFQSEQASRILDVPASITATGRNGGIPALIFQKSKQIRRVLILEDTGAEARGWNPIAAELAEGLSRRAVPVTHGLFRGGPEQFATTDGATLQLEDIEDQRHGYLVLIFSDGKGLQGRRDTFALERLSHWPRVAWMEFREPKFWDDSTALPARHGISIFPADREGLLKAAARFLTEQSDREELAATANWRGVPAYTGQNLNAHLEQILGEALPWAQACAMMQPVTLGLAEAVRQRFLPDLPAERIGRLFALPDTLHNVSGLRFSPAVLAILRAGFAGRWEEQKQEEVLRFLLEKINEAEPVEAEPVEAEPEAAGSPAHLAWEMKREQVHLELDPEAALQRLAELAGTPVGAALRAELEKTVLPGETRTGGIPLRRKPKDKNALQRLARLAENSGVKKLEAYPIALGHRLGLGFLFLSFIGFAVSALSSLRQVDRLNERNVFFFPPDSATVLTKLEAAIGPNEWETIAAEPIAMPLTSTQWKISQPAVGDTYRFVTFSAGMATDTIFALSTNAFGFRTRLQPERRPCTEEFPEIGLSINRCDDQAGLDPVVSPGWRETVLKSDRSAQNWLSIGIEISTYRRDRTPAFNESVLEQEFRQRLLRTRSVDAFYRIFPANDGSMRVAEALEQIKKENAPWLDKTQVIYWLAGANANTLAPDLSAFASVLQLGDDPVDAWLTPLKRIWLTGKSAVFDENEILSALGKPPVSNVPSVLLIRSTADTVLSPQPTTADSTLSAVPPRTLYLPPDTVAMMLIPGGTFLMGSNDGEDDEKPEHRVQVDSFYMDIHEVTVAQYRRFLNAMKRQEPGQWKEQLQYPNRPVVYVSWDDANEYTKWAGKRLPTEAEWEYAARGGFTGVDGKRKYKYPWGDEIDSSRANFDSDNSRTYGWEEAKRYLRNVGSYAANNYGLFDMSGNVWEWCSDWYDENYYQISPSRNPEGLMKGEYKVLRGGGWLDLPNDVRCAYRDWGRPIIRNSYVGFRCVQDAR